MPKPTDEILYAPLGTMTYKRGEDGFLYVTGTVSNDTLDLDKQICDPDWIDREAPEWFKIGNTRVMHQPVVGGKATELAKVGTGWVATIKITNPQAATDVEEGALTGLSIGIKGARVITDEGAPNGRIVDGKWVEVSLVDRPANPDCKLAIAKMAGDVLTLEEGVEIVPEVEPVVEPVAEPVVEPEAEPEAEKSAQTDQFGWSDEDKAAWTPLQKQLMPDSVKKDYSDKERSSMAASGQALPGGGYPIKNVSDLKNAIQAVGRAKNPSAAKAHIKSRAKALGQEDLIPDNWKMAHVASLASVLTKASDGDTYLHDAATLASVRDGLVECIKAELDEFAAGEDESWDVSQLMCSLTEFLSWWQGEAAEGEVSSPYEGDDMSLVTLGVSADLVKVATADGATDEDKNALKTALRETLGIEDTSTIKAANAELLEKVTNLEEQLVDVKKMAAPKGISLRGTQDQQDKAAEADALEEKALRYRAIAMSSTDGTVAKQYKEAADTAANRARELRAATI